MELGSEFSLVPKSVPLYQAKIRSFQYLKVSFSYRLFWFWLFADTPNTMLSEIPTYFLQSCKTVIIITYYYPASQKSQALRVNSELGFRPRFFPWDLGQNYSALRILFISNGTSQCWMRPEGYNRRGAAGLRLWDPQFLCSPIQSPPCPQSN